MLPAWFNADDALTRPLNEGVEYAVDYIRRNRHSAIIDPYLHARAIVRDHSGDLDRHGTIPMLHGVSQQVGKYLSKPTFVPVTDKATIKKYFKIPVGMNGPHFI